LYRDEVEQHNKML